MSLERWQRVQDIFQQALAVPEADRGAFVQSACGGEIDLYEEVISLVAAPTVDEPPALWRPVLVPVPDSGTNLGTLD
mgnify:CR=1 FL=1